MIKNDNSQENKGLTDTSERRLQTSLQTNAENSQKSEQNLPPELAEIIEVWPELPKHIKQAISALVQTQIEQGSSMGGYYWKKKGNVEDCTKL